MDSPDALVPLCARSGLLGADAESAIRAYRNYGPIATEDRERMASMNQPERDAYVVTRWGSDGARVANIVQGAGA